jgi:hypothetical protein
MYIRILSLASPQIMNYKSQRQKNKLPKYL